MTLVQSKGDHSNTDPSLSVLPTVCVVGLGYVGLPLAEAFARSLPVIGFDTDCGKIEQLSRRNGIENMTFVDDPNQIGKAEFVIICVPTPVTKSKEPDLSYVRGAAQLVGQYMGCGCTVILESTVYPGVTEEVVKPILEGYGFECGRDFRIGYSPERINPGDNEHAIEMVTKVVAGMDEETTNKLVDLYGRITPNTFKAKNIKTAEAAKVIENIQRDLNIALMNELALIFDKMGLDTNDVLDAAATKWNFHRYSPGLVGGHCIPVDPYYLVYKAEELGYHPQVILAGRAINDYMPKHVAEMTIKALNNAGKVIKGSRVLLMGLTYKENVPDTRETPVKGIIKELQTYGVDIWGYDPLLEDGEIEFGIKMVYEFEQVPKVDAMVLATAHAMFRQLAPHELASTMESNPILIDVRGFFEESEMGDTCILHVGL
ncbi:MAG: nucleotide sugar dehydrogenase [Chloroflexota bacterium]|nr:nucleotide sugar dehydrogenase [Chloroflexota bacterium]